MSRPPLYYGWFLVAVGGGAWILATGIYYTFGVFFKPVAAEFGWSRATTSLAFSLSTASAGLSAPLLGILADKYGPRRMVLVGGLMVAVCYTILSQTLSLVQFYLFFILVGVGLTTIWVSIPAMVNRWFVGRRGLAQGLVGTGGGLGAVVFPPLANFLIFTTGWRNAYLLLGLGAGLLLALLSFFLRRDPQGMGLAPYGSGPVAKASPPPQYAYSLTQALRSPTYWRVFFIASLFILSYLMVLVHFVPYATDKGVTPMAAAGLVSALGASSIAGRLFWGAISDRLGRGSTLGLTLAIGGGLFFLLLTASDWEKMLLFAILFGFIYGGWMVNLTAFQADLFGVAAIGAILGVTELAMDLGGAAGGYLAGYIFDVTDSYSVAFLIGAISLFLASGLAFSLTSPRSQR